MRQIQVAGYPLSRLVADILQKSGLNRHEFLKSLGYRKESNGFLSLYACLESGFATDFFLRSIVRVYPPDPVSWRVAMLDLEQRRQQALAQARVKFEQVVLQRERRRRVQFQPFIHVETEHTVPSSITVAALTGCYMKYLRLKDWPACSEKAATYATVEGFDQLTPAQQIVLVARVVTTHFRYHQGYCPLFGKITGYRYFHQYDQSLLLDVNGTVVGEETGTHPWPGMSIRIGNKRHQGQALKFLRFRHLSGPASDEPSI